MKRGPKPKTNSDVLNGRQVHFCQEYVSDFNGKRAAIAAGYSERTAESQASDLLRLPKVQKRIDELKRALADKAAMKGADVIAELSLLGNTDIANYLELDGTGKVKVKLFEKMPPGASRCIKKIRQKVTVSGDLITELELWDKPRALDLLGQYHTLWSQNGGGALSPEDAAAGLLRIAAAIEGQNG